MLSSRPVYRNEVVGVHQQDHAPAGLRLDEQARVDIGLGSIMPDGWDTRECSIVPAHAIRAGSFSPYQSNGRRMHGRNPCRREDGRGPKAPSIHLRDEVVGHILGTGDQGARRKVRRIVVIKRSGHPKEPPVVPNTSHLKDLDPFMAEVKSAI